jgi:hypothetical protein
MSDSPIPVICDRCREQGLAGDDPFTAIRDLLNFDPVPRRAHVNGWTPEHQSAFIAALAMTGSPRQAARAIGRFAYGADQLRRAKGGRSFAEAWDAALELYREREFFRIKDNLAGLAEQQEQRDQGAIVETHLRALPPPSPSPLAGEGGAHASAWEGEGAWSNSHDCPHCDPDLAAERRAAREYDESTRKVRRKLFMCRRLYLQTIANSPERRAAWELLCGPADWDAALELKEQPDERAGDPTDLTPLQHAQWQIPLKTGFAPDLTDPRYDPYGDPLRQLEASVRRHDPRGSTERSDASPSPLAGAPGSEQSGGWSDPAAGQGEG